MAERPSYVIIGNGIAGATAADILCEEDITALVTVIADDPFPTYYRPALKDYLGGKVREDKLWVRPINFYSNRHVRFLADRVVGIHPGQHMVQLRSGQTLSYSRLLLAHGARNDAHMSGYKPGRGLDAAHCCRLPASYQPPQHCAARCSCRQRDIGPGNH